MKNKYITFCGIDGSGKSTQASLLSQYLSDRLGKRVVKLHGLKPSTQVKKLKTVSQNLSDNIVTDFTPDIVAMSLLFDYWKNYQETILPALQEDKIVIVEREYSNIFLYCEVFGSSEEFIKLFDPYFLHPDIYIFLDINDTLAFERVCKRAAEKGEKLSLRETPEIMRKMKDKLFEFYAQKKNFIYIDVTNLTPEQVSKEIIEKISLILT